MACFQGGSKVECRTCECHLGRDADDIHGVRDLFQAFEEDPTVEPDEATWRILIRAYEQSEEWSDELEKTRILRSTWKTLHEG